MQVDPIGEPAPHNCANVLPDERVGKLRLDLTRAAVDTEQRFEHDEHELWILTRSPTTRVIRLRYHGGELVGRGVVQDRIETLERTDRTCVHWRLLVFGLGPVLSHNPSGAIKTANAQQPCYSIDPPRLIQ